MKVVDSSVSLKWFVDEPRREGARALLELDDELIAPEFSYAEVANVLWRKVRIAQIAFEQADAAVGRLPALISLRSVSGPAMRTALGLAKQLDHSVYDCIFLAMALEFDDATFVTDDTRFAEKAVSAGFGERIRTLSDGPIRVVFSDAQLQSMLELFHRHRHVLEFRQRPGRSPFRSDGVDDLFDGRSEAGLRLAAICQVEEGNIRALLWSGLHLACGGLARQGNRGAALFPICLNRPRTWPRTPENTRPT